jgi:hypothetical protein
LAGDDPVLDKANTDNNSDMKREAKHNTLHRMGKVHDMFEMWQSTKNLQATQKDSCGQHKPMSAVKYILVPEEIVKASLSNFQHHGVAAFKLSGRLPVPPALSAKNLPRGQMHVLNVYQIQRIDCQSGKSDKVCALEHISDTKTWLEWNGDLDDPNDSEDDWEAHNESEIELDNGVNDSHTSEV